MGGHVAKLGKQLGGAVEAYNRTVTSLESRVLVTARRFGELGVVTDELDTPEQVERSPRTVQAVELVASATDALVALDLVERKPDFQTAPGPARDSEPELPSESWNWVTEALHQARNEDHERSTVNE
jgi:DNA recombination protein RmuC